MHLDTSREPPPRYTVLTMVTRKIPSKPRATRNRTAPKQKVSVWEEIAEIGRMIPPEELAKFPRDGARNLEHHLYGAPKQDPD